MTTRMAPLALALLVLLAATAIADVVFLKDGSRMEGKVLEDSPKGVKIQTEWGEAFIARDKILQVVIGTPKPENPCPFCEGVGQVVCSRCSGSKIATGCCKACIGQGKVECTGCRGGKKVRCSECKGTGSRDIFVPGRGFGKGKCGHCNGYGWLYCGKCRGDGRAPCSKCKGASTGPCGNCEAKGVSRCPLCGGTGDRKESRPFLKAQFKAFLKELRDPTKTDLQRNAVWEGAVGKWVIWNAVVLNANKDGGATYLELCLDESDLAESSDEQGNRVMVYASHAYAYVRDEDLVKAAALVKGQRIVVIAEISAWSAGLLRLMRAEVASGDSAQGK